MINQLNGQNDLCLEYIYPKLDTLCAFLSWNIRLSTQFIINFKYVMFQSYRVFAGNLQKRNWKIDTSLGRIGAQNLFSSLYKLG